MRITRYIIAIITAISLITAPAYSAGDFLSSRVKDISDRKYEGAVIELLDNAKDSIVMSMYFLNLSDTKNPASLMVNDLLEARERGVDVSLYLNTTFQDADRDRDYFIQNLIIKSLKAAGCKIHLMPSARKLHDKLVIVDNRFIAEGSTNWSISGLRMNLESSTLIDSPDLAEIKLERLKAFMRLIKKEEESTYTPYYTKNLLSTLKIPNTLLLDKQCFSRMVTSKDSRAIDLYLLLLAHSQLTKKDGFFLNLEDMGLSLGLPKDHTDVALRRQVIKSLKKLKRRYKLIDVDFYHAKNAYIVILPAPSVVEGSPRGEGSGFFTIPTNTIINNRDLSMRLKFLLLIEAYLRSEGEDIDFISSSTLAQRFGTHESTLHQARKEFGGVKYY